MLQEGQRSLFDVGIRVCSKEEAFLPTRIAAEVQESRTQRLRSEALAREQHVVNKKPVVGRPGLPGPRFCRLQGLFFAWLCWHRV